MRRRGFLGLAATAILAACQPISPEADATYYLVRHAEKTAEKSDPGLTVAGQQRAKDLAARLKDVKLTKIYSSDYIRTRGTAAPIAAAKKLEVTLYDARDLEGFSKQLLDEKGYFLVVGHSNTTPPLSELLGGEAGEPIVEATEYDRLYILERRGDKVMTSIKRFGEKS